MTKFRLRESRIATIVFLNIFCYINSIGSLWILLGVQGPFGGPKCDLEWALKPVIYVYIHICGEESNWLTGSFVKNGQVVGRSHKFSHVLVLDPKASEASHASEARHAQSEATRRVNVNYT